VFCNHADHLDEAISRGKSDIVLNGRRLRDEDLLLLKAFGFPGTPGRWCMDGDGNFTIEQSVAISNDGTRATSSGKARAALKGSSSAFLASASVSSFKTSLQQQQQELAAVTSTSLEINVPSFRKVNDKVVYYSLDIKLIGGTQPLEWHVERRFSDFQAFHTVLKKRFAGMNLPALPPAVSIAMIQTSFLENRRAALEVYVSEVRGER
jgi:hypothetical protein